MRKRILALAFACAFAAVMLSPLTAFAESNLGVSTAITPETLVEAGSVEIALKIANNGSATLEDVTLSIPGKKDAVLGNLGPGDRKSFQISNFSVSADQVGVPFAFRFKWVENGSNKSLEYPVTIGVKEVNSALEARRDLSKTLGASGDLITVTYALENKGNVDLTDVTITDPISDQPIASGLTLAVGSGVKKVNFGLTLNKSVTSKPTVTAKGGGKTVTVEIPPTEIVLAEPKLEITPVVGKSDGTNFPIEIKLKNTGNVALKNIVLSDEQKQIQSNIALAPGEEKSVSYAVRASDTRTFVVTAAAIAEGLEGPAATISFLSTGIELTSAAPDPGASDLLAITVTPSATQLAQSGEVEFAIKLNNTGAEAIKNVTVKEKSAGEIKAFTDLKMGVTTVKAKITVPKTMTFSFYVEYPDASGATKTLSAEPIKIEITAGGSPQNTNQPAISGGLSTLTLIMIGLGVLLLVAVVGLVIVLGQERRRKERQQESEELGVMMQRKEQRESRAERKRSAEAPAETSYSQRRTARNEPVQDPRSAQTGRTYAPMDAPAERPARSRPRPEPLIDVELPQQPSQPRRLSDEELFEREFMDDDE